MTGRIEDIHVAARAGEPMSRLERAEARAGSGLDGDRYATGLGYRRDEPVSGETVDGFPESRLVFRTRFVQVDGAVGTPRVCEPDKAAGWDWHAWSALPSPLFAPVSSLVRSGWIA